MGVMAVGIGHYLVVSAILLVLGVFGIFLNRKNVIVIMMSIELILLAVTLNLVAFSAALGDLAGQVMAMFVLTVAAAEAAIGPQIAATTIPVTEAPMAARSPIARPSRPAIMAPISGAKTATA